MVVFVSGVWVFNRLKTLFFKLIPNEWNNRNIKWATVWNLTRARPCKYLCHSHLLKMNLWIVGHPIFFITCCKRCYFIAIFLSSKSERERDRERARVRRILKQFYFGHCFSFEFTIYIISSFHSIEKKKYSFRNAFSAFAMGNCIVAISSLIRPDKFSFKWILACVHFIIHIQNVQNCNGIFFVVVL